MSKKNVLKVKDGWKLIYAPSENKPTKRNISKKTFSPYGLLESNHNKRNRIDVNIGNSEV